MLIIKDFKKKASQIKDMSGKARTNLLRVYTVLSVRRASDVRLRLFLYFRVGFLREGVEDL